MAEVIGGVAALGLAANIVQFVDYGIRLVAKTQEVYQSANGLLKEHIELEEITEDVKTLTGHILTSTADHGHVRDAGLKALARNCQDLSNELLHLLTKLHRKNGPIRTWQSVKAAIQGLRRAREIKDLEKRMWKLKEQICFHLTATLSQKHTQLQLSVGEILELSKNNAKGAELKLEFLREQVSRYVKSTKWDLANNDAFSKLSKDLSELFFHERLVNKIHAALKSLYFDQIDVRQSDVQKSYGKSFEWIFREDEKGHGTKFMNWIQSGDDFFWISGKAGSGKSTLMKFLCNHKRTAGLLERWAAPKKFILSSHYFWNIGTRLQKSHEGLFRTLLFQVWNQCPELIPDSLLDSPKSLYHYRTGWTTPDLLEQLKLIGHAAEISHKFCFFIDGLDEYEGDHLDIIKDIELLSRSPNIKICASSRPWTVFRGAFEASPDKMFLHELTQDDIRQYIRENLQANKTFGVLHISDPDGSSSLVNTLQDKAQGVFLWVFLVVRSLLQGLQYGDDISDLQRRLEQLPPDLEAYFRHIFGGIEHFYRQQTAQIFLILQCADGSLPLLTFHFLQCIWKDPDFPVHYEGETITKTTAIDINEQQRKRLDARCRDLVEIGDLSSGPLFSRFPVRFLHRTVSDFLGTSDMHNSLKAWAGASFNPLATLCGCLLCQIKCDPPEQAKLVHLMLQYSKKIEMQSRAPPIALLDNLDSVIMTSISKENPLSPHLPSTAWSRPEKLESEHPNPLYRRQGLNFVEFAAAYGLELYVISKIQELQGGENALDLHFLLLFTLATPNITLGGKPLDRCVDRKIQLSLIGKLLELGANPNHCLEMTGRTVWQEFVLYLNRMFTHEKIFQKYTEPEGIPEGFIQSLYDESDGESSSEISSTASSDPLQDEMFASWYAACELLLRNRASTRSEDFLILARGFSKKHCASLKSLSVNTDVYIEDGDSDVKKQSPAKGFQRYLSRFLP